MKDSDAERTPIGEVGKYGLIDHLKGKVSAVNKSTITGIGDDASVIDSGVFFTLVSTDLLLEGIHFSLVYFPLKHLGYKLVIRAISDIYAMNGIPEQLLLGIGISSRFSLEQVDEIFEGALMACNKYGVDIAGGDTTSSLTGLALSVTSVGRVEKKNLIKRSGAKPNDLICVTGDLGSAYAGLQVLEREKKVFEQSGSLQPDLSGYDYVLSRQLRPEIPVKILNAVKSEGIEITSMIDITEGLASDLMQICKSSGTGCRIFNNQIPVDYETSRVAEEMNIDPLVTALNGGDDFELLFTTPLDNYEKVRKIEQLSVIGHITAEGSGNYLVGSNGSEIELTAQGWPIKK